MSDFKMPPPFTRMITTPRAPAVVTVVRPAPKSREEWRATAARVAPPIMEPTSDKQFYKMPTERLPIDPPALAHLRKPRATAVIAVKAAAQPVRKPVARTVGSIGAVPGQEITGTVER